MHDYSGAEKAQYGATGRGAEGPEAGEIPKGETMVSSPPAVPVRWPIRGVFALLTTAALIATGTTVTTAGPRLIGAVRLLAAVRSVGDAGHGAAERLTGPEASGSIRGPSHVLSRRGAFIRG